MKNFTIIFFAVVCTTIASAQVTEDWIRAESSLDYLGAMIARDGDDNVFTISNNFKILGGGTDIWVTKRDNTGSLLWSVNYDNTTGSQWDAATWITIDPLGNAIVTGYTNSPLTNYVPVQLIVMKFRGTDGTLLWRNTYSTGSACRAWRALTDDDGNIYVGGDTLAQRIDHIDYGSLMVKKYSPNGNEMWSVNKDASGNLMQGPMSSMKFTKDGHIIIAGVRLKAPYKNEAAELTTDGTVLWSREETGFAATDVTSTADGFVYQLWNDGDMRINKLTSTGSLVWSKAYDFGSGDIGRKIEADQNDNIIVTGLTTQLTGLPYTDWMTFMINCGGDQLWSDRYNEHINNDEYPNFMVLDHDNNIYITGQGGPFTGGGDLGALQLVTIKYLPDGSREWVAVNDSITQSGIALCLTSTNGVDVVGRAFAATIQYSQGAQVSCNPPGNLTTKKIQQTSAKLVWSAVDGAVYYQVVYKEASSNNSVKKKVPGTATSLKLTNLTCNTNYQWKIKTVCDTSGTIISDYSGPQTFTTASCKLSEEVTIPSALSMTCFPNPATDAIDLELSSPASGTIELRNITGQVCRKLVMNDTGVTSVRIDVSSLPPGIYLMTFSDGQNRLLEKIIIQ